MGMLGVTLAALSPTLGSAANATPGVTTPNAVTATGEPALISDELSNPSEAKRRELREEALSQVINGTKKAEKRGASTVVKLGKKGPKGTPSGGDQYVELAREATDRVFVILAEFGNTRHPSYPDQDTDAATPGPARFDGPLRNEIPAPDRAVDNSTNWRPDYNQAYFEQMYFGSGAGVESLKTYYESQSSGRYSVNGTVTNWVKVPYNEARYGRSNGFPCGSNVCTNTWALVRDAANQWYADQLASGRSAADVNAELATFDQWDRYDFDGDGNFNESDGYIDHFQIVHSGGDQADGDPFQGEDAIWSHRWATFQNLIGSAGPVNNLNGGNQIGTSGIWIYDYTIQPENGGRSVFFHEYGHDLGLPDDYNVLSGGDNNSEYWTLMAQSRLGAAGEQSIGDRAGDLGAWNKLQLGWLNYATVQAGSGQQTINLGPEEYNSAKPQALVVTLPKKPVVTQLGAPASGAKQWFSGDANGLENTLTRQVTLPAGSASLTFKARWDIEDCGPDPCDYAYVEVSTDSGAHWTAIPGNITKVDEGNGIDGVQAAYTPASFDLSAYANQTIGLRFRYSTDTAAAGNDGALPNGIFIDDINLTAGGATVLSDGAESGDNGWTLSGFTAAGASFTTMYDHFYIAGNRSYVSYDRYLQTGPYYFGYGAALPDKVDHFSYQQGLLISYWDRSYNDNDTFAHPGSGRNLYIDAHPQPQLRADGAYWRARVQVFDAPFGLTAVPGFDLHQNGVLMHVNGSNAQPVFDDGRTYWYPELPNHGVILPAVGVKIIVQSVSGTTMKVKVMS
ncbi:immune inhibitor A domain-containing protein [Rhizocola hellebori]|uniref:immune inhibitor A domain-containing protein n=1 Tax=Rhizocola hellebori TaxID=1392758 RepID=UPI001943980A|nr:immune inhibitor A domain-containing protein [Rhizocola hellebori]